MLQKSEIRYHTSTVELGYNDLSLTDTAATALYIVVPTNSH